MLDPNNYKNERVVHCPICGADAQLREQDFRPRHPMWVCKEGHMWQPAALSHIDPLAPFAR